MSGWATAALGKRWLHLRELLVQCEVSVGPASDEQIVMRIVFHVFQAVWTTRLEPDDRKLPEDKWWIAYEPDYRCVCSTGLAALNHALSAAKEEA